MRTFHKADRDLWRRSFGSAKEEPAAAPAAKAPGRNSWGASASSENAFKRLLSAMRSRAPGSWSDNRWAQDNAFEGIQYVAIHRLATMMSQAEFKVQRKNPNEPDGEADATGPDAEALIEYLEKPNWKDSFGSWMYRLTQQKWLTGTALDWVIPNRLGRPLNHYLTPTGIMVPQPVMNPEFPDGFYRVQPVYPYGPFSSYPTPFASVGAPIPAEWVVRFEFPHPLLWYEGYSPATALRLHIDGVKMMDQSRFYKMKGSINPSAKLRQDADVDGMEPMPPEEVERIHAEWEQFQGVDNHGKMIVCPPGFDLEEFGRSPVEMDYNDSWAQLVSFVLGGLGITKPAAGMIEDSSYSTLFATLKQVNVLTIQPECDSIASVLTRQVGGRFGDDLVVKIRSKRIDDHDILFKKLDILIATNAITYNQLLKELDMPTTTEPWGNERVGEVSSYQRVTPEEGESEHGGELERETHKEDHNQDRFGQEQRDRADRFGQEQRDRADADMEGADEAAARARPKPGPLGRGSLGPRDKIHDKRLAATVNRIEGMVAKSAEQGAGTRRRLDELARRLRNGRSRNGNGRH